MGNLSSSRDWGHAKDYVKAMYLILQQDKPDDYVIATGITTTIRDFIRKSGEEIGLEIGFNGDNASETGVILDVDEAIFTEKVGKEHLNIIYKKIKESSIIVGIDPQYFRPTEVDLLIGDATKAKTKLGWTPKYDLNGLISDMMSGDIKFMKKEAWIQKGGFKTMNYFE